VDGGLDPASKALKVLLAAAYATTTRSMQIRR
jgi:hypothetical protein